MDRKNIKRNKIMRAWYRYQKIIGVIAAALVLMILLISLIGRIGKKNDPDDKVANASTAPTQGATQETTDPVQIPTEPVTEPITEPPTTAGARSPVIEDFTNEAFYEDAVLLGDTFVAGIGLYTMLDAKKVVADTVWTVSRAQSNGVTKATANKPAKVIIELGINDLNYEGRTSQRIYDDFALLVQEIKKQSPDTTVYIVSIFPISSGFESKSYIENKKVKEVNDMLAGMEGIRYIDLYGAMIDGSGYLNTDLSTDGLHIKKAYYAYILNSIAELAQAE